MAQAVYLDYDQQALDSELNLRARWPEHPQVLASWAEASARVRREQVHHQDLAYGRAPGERLDLFPVPDADQAPLVAFIHGGYWQALDKGDFSYLAPAFLARGIAFASLNYDLAPTVSLSEIATQIDRALAWLRQRAADFGCAPDAVVVAGHSAGGQLATLALSRDVQSGGTTTALPPLLGACSVSGVYDLDAIRLSYHQTILSITAAEAEALSPQNQLPAQKARFLLAVGSEETAEFHRQQAVYLALCQAAGHAVETIALPQRNHFTAIDALGEAEHPLFLAICQLLQK